MLEEKIDKLTAAVDRLTAAMEGGEGAPAAEETTKKPAAKKPAAKKSKFTTDQVKAKFAALKADENVGPPPLKKLISDQGFADLAELLLSPDKFEDVMEALEALETEAAEANDDDDL